MKNRFLQHASLSLTARPKPSFAVGKEMTLEEFSLSTIIIFINHTKIPSLEILS